MDFLLDEMVPRDVMRFLINRGHTCKTLKELNQLGISNGEVVIIAIESQLVIITCDADYIKLKKTLQEKCRIIYIKIHPRDPKRLVVVLSENIDF